MTKQENLINWLIIGIRQHPESQSEFFYFDRSLNHFFSLIAADFSIGDQTQVDGYSSQDLDIIRKKLQLVADNSDKLISVPRIQPNDQYTPKQVDEAAEKLAHLFLEQNQIDTETCGFWFPEGDGK